MTVQPALARLERGYRRMWAWCVAKAQGARPYRFDGEERIHADQLRETQVALAMMVGADQGDPDQQRMATDFEGGAETRLRVLLDLPILTTGQKRERDAIQFALQARRQSFDAPRLVQRTDGGWRPQGFAALPMLGGFRLWMLFGAASVAALAVWQIDSARLRFERDRSCKPDETAVGADTSRRPCIDLGDTQRQLEHSRAALVDATRMVREADANAMRTAETLRALERQRRLREEQRRRSQIDVQSILSGVGDPPDLGLRDGEPAAADNSDGSSGNANPR